MSNSCKLNRLGWTTAHQIRSSDAKEFEPPSSGVESDRIVMPDTSHVNASICKDSQTAAHKSRRALLMTAVWGNARPWSLAASARLFVRSALDIVVIGDQKLANAAPREPLSQQLRIEFVDALRIRQSSPADEFAVQRFEHFAATLHELQSQGRNYTHVMVCDASDVLLQDDPFESVESNTVIFSLEAGIKIKEQTHNSHWVRNLIAAGANGSLPQGPTAGRTYDGCAMLEEIGDKIVSCSGATLGTADAMMAYLDDMASIIAALPVRLNMGMDQVSIAI